MIDILDRLQTVNGFVRLVLKSGEIMFGKPDCIVYDEEGYDTRKSVRFEPWMDRRAIYFKADEIESFDEYSEKEISEYE